MASVKFKSIDIVNFLKRFLYFLFAEKRGHKGRRHAIIHKPFKPHLISRHKKHDIFTLAAPPSIGSLLPSATHMTLMPNGVPTATGEYIHHLMHRHPLNIPVYHGYHPHGVYPVHLPEHYGPLGPFGHHMFYRHGPWKHGLGYGVRYPFAHGFVRGPWYSSLGHGFGFGYPRRFRHGLHFGHVPAGYGFPHGYGHGYHGYGHVTGELLLDISRVSSCLKKTFLYTIFSSHVITCNIPCIKKESVLLCHESPLESSSIATFSLKLIMNRSLNCNLRETR